LSGHNRAKPLVIESGRVESGYVDTRYASELEVQLVTIRVPTRLPVDNHSCDFTNDFFAVPEYGRVYEVGHGLRVVSAVPANDDERI
jgi:hypothetical protein